MGQNTFGTPYERLLTTLGCANMHSHSFQSTHDPSYPHPLRPKVPKISFRLNEPCAVNLPSRPLPPLASPTFPPLLFLVFRRLARGLQRRSWLGSHQTEQAQVDRPRGPETRLARWLKTARGPGVDPKPALRQDGVRLRV